MAELVDALDSKSGYRKVVQVRFLFWAQRPWYEVPGFSFEDVESLLLKGRKWETATPSVVRGLWVRPPSWELQAERSSAQRILRRNEVEPTILHFLANERTYSH
jgi:hypothetical protein